MRRYERENPGDLIDIDIKKLGRFGVPATASPAIGPASPTAVDWEYVHVAIDDASRLTFTQILPNEKKESAIRIPQGGRGYYTSLCITVTRVITDWGDGRYSRDGRGLYARGRARTRQPPFHHRTSLMRVGRWHARPVMHR